MCAASVVVFGQRRWAEFILLVREPSTTLLDQVFELRKMPGGAEQDPDALPQIGW
jgi:hypothetical protein